MAQRLVEIRTVLFVDPKDPRCAGVTPFKARTTVHISDDKLRLDARIQTGNPAAICRHNTWRMPPRERNVAQIETPGPDQRNWFQIFNNLGGYSQFLPFISKFATNWPRNDTLHCTESVSFRLALRGKQNAE